MVALNKKKQSRLMVLNGVEVGKVTTGETAEVPDLSLRHVRRISAAYRKEGARALAHGNRGGKPHNIQQLLIFFHMSMSRDIFNIISFGHAPSFVGYPYPPSPYRPQIPTTQHFIKPHSNYRSTVCLPLLALTT